jgi:hypothetical protein
MPDSTRVPYPSEDEINAAIVQDHAIAACSGVPCAVGKAMKFAFRNGDTSTVVVDHTGALALVSALLVLFPDIQSSPGFHAVARVEGQNVKAGHISDRPDRAAFLRAPGR